MSWVRVRSTQGKVRRRLCISWSDSRPCTVGAVHCGKRHASARRPRARQGGFSGLVLRRRADGVQSSRRAAAPHDVPAGARGIRARGDRRSALRDGAVGHRDDAVPAAVADASDRPRRCSAAGTPCRKRRRWQPPTERERLYVATAEAFFLEPASSDYWLRIRRWEQATGEGVCGVPGRPRSGGVLRARAPGDDARRTSCRARTPTAPPRSCCASTSAIPIIPARCTTSSTPTTCRAASTSCSRSRASTSRSRRDNPHALHMPTHIYTRLGDWDAVIRGNLRAADAALEYPAGEHGEFVWDEFPHAIEYLVYAYLQQGADDEAAAQLERLRDTPRLEPTFKTAFHSASTQARYVLERRAWNEAVAIVPREPAALDWDRFTWPEAVAWFARGLGAAHLRQADDARAASQRLEQLEAATRAAARNSLRATSACCDSSRAPGSRTSSGQQESSVATMREAVDARDLDTQASGDACADDSGLRTARRPVDGAEARRRGARRVPALAGALSASFQHACSARRGRRVRSVTNRPRAITTGSSSRWPALRHGGHRSPKRATTADSHAAACLRRMRALLSSYSSWDSTPASFSRKCSRISSRRCSARDDRRRAVAIRRCAVSCWLKHRMARKVPRWPVNSEQSRPPADTEKTERLGRAVQADERCSRQPAQATHRRSGARSCCHHTVDDELIHHATAMVSAASTTVVVIHREGMWRDSCGAGSTNRRSSTYCETAPLDRHVRTDR